MAYEDDYKMWLEKMVIEMNPDWICDGMADKEFTQDWCEEYCGKDDAYITPKCLHVYYHHIASADRKTEPQTKRPCDGCVCDDGKHLMYCMNCKGIARQTEPPKTEPRKERTSR